MKSGLQILLLGTVALNLTGCMALLATQNMDRAKSSYNYEAPKFEMPNFDIDPTIGGLLSCDKADSDLVINEQAQKDRFTLKKITKLTKYESVKCDDSIEDMGELPQPEKLLFVKVPSLSKTMTEVTSLEVTNQKSCSTIKIPVTTAIEEKIEIPSNMNFSEITQKQKNVNLLKPNGAARILILESKYAIMKNLIAQEGLNVLDIKYLGRCLKTEGENCLESEVLGTHQIVFDLKVETESNPTPVRFEKTQEQCKSTAAQ